MKKHFFSALLMILFSAACSNDEPEETADAGDFENVTEEAADENEDGAGTEGGSETGASGEHISSDSETTENAPVENTGSNDSEDKNPKDVEESEEQSESENYSTEESDVDSEQGEQSDDEEITEDAAEEEIPASDVAQLSAHEKAALIMMDNRSSDYTFSADELISQRFQLIAPGAPDNSPTAIFDLVMQDYGIADGISGLPEGMVIYNITPSSGNFASFIGFNDETAVVYGSQYNVQTYDEILAGGIELDLQELYSRHGDNSNIQQAADKISITNEIDTYQPVTAGTAAKIWAFAESESTEGIESLHFDIHMDPVNPYQPEATVSYPPQTYVISSSPTAGGGVVIFTMNADGSFRLYDAPTRFSDERWMNNQQYSRQATDDILNSSEVHHIDDLGHLYTGDILNIMVE